MSGRHYNRRGGRSGGGRGREQQVSSTPKKPTKKTVEDYFFYVGSEVWYGFVGNIVESLVQYPGFDSLRGWPLLQAFLCRCGFSQCFQAIEHLPRGGDSVGHSLRGVRLPVRFSTHLNK